MSNSKFVSVGVRSPTEINAPRGCAVILIGICQLLWPESRAKSHGRSTWIMGIRHWNKNVEVIIEEINKMMLESKAPTMMPADCSVLCTPTILPIIRISWDGHPTFRLILGRVPRPFIHLWASSCGFRPFDPGIIKYEKVNRRIYAIFIENML